MPKIKVAEKALAHLSRGLYRSPASALRELVSNAWDANATMVRMDTNYPNFFQISVEDNGNGFTRDEFQKLMEGGIGISNKRSDPETLIHNRPIIGRLGIGMLGIAQICGAFTILSKTQEGKEFQARIRLYDVLKERLDNDDGTIVRTHEVDIGEYDFADSFDFSTVGHGTTIIADDVHPTFFRSFQDSLEHDTFRKPPLEWAQALRIVSQYRSLEELGDYWKLLWELAAACPVPYLDKNALPDQLIAEEDQQLRNYSFRVIVNGIELFKPVYLEGHPGGYTTQRIERQRQKVYGKELAFHGYLVVQEGAQLKPDELRGIMIRIKNIGVGYYDPSLLGYRINEGPRAKWLTGEIFVDAGLEDALNIDRDSFNRFHPEYRAIQEYVHQVLQQKLFPQVYREIDKRSAKRAETRAGARREHLTNVISQAMETGVHLEQNTVPMPSGHVPKVSIVERESEVQVQLPEPEAMKTKKTHRQLATAVLAIYEVAARKETAEEQRKAFTELLLELLARW